MATDPLQHRAYADLVVQRAADQLHELLKTVTANIDPFPAFPGSMFSYGIEIAPGSGAADRFGCVVLGEDGELYELRIGLDVEQVESGNPLAMRSEERVQIEDLPPAEYVGYAHRALTAAVDYLLDRHEVRLAAPTAEPPPDGSPGPGG